MPEGLRAAPSTQQMRHDYLIFFFLYCFSPCLKMGIYFSPQSLGLVLVFLVGIGDKKQAPSPWINYSEQAEREFCPRVAIMDQ